MTIREGKRKKSGNARSVGAIFLAVSTLFISACQPNQAILDSQNTNRNSDMAVNSNAPTLNDFERDIQSMKNANFDFIYVFRRKDGGKITAEDGKFAKANSPLDTNRFIISDEQRAIIAGSNSRFALVNLEALKSGFVVEDSSKPENELKNANANANANVNVNSANK